MLRLLKASFIIALGLDMGACSQQTFSPSPSQVATASKITWNNQVDILWVIDNTPRMGQHQQILSKTAPNFLNGLISRGLDFRVATTSVDMRTGGNDGAFIGTPSVITPNTPDIMNVFLSKILIGEQNYTVGQGLAAMQAAMNMRDTTNTGFFRNKALLVLIFISNENDKSPGNSSDYINYLNTLKPRTPLGDMNWVADFIGVTALAGEDCTTFGAYSDPGYRYMDLANASGGSISTICTVDLTAALKGVETRIYEVSSKFYLDMQPMSGTITVTVNSVSVPQDPVNGWTYNSADNSVQLHGSSILRAEVPVIINYTPATPK